MDFQALGSNLGYYMEDNNDQSKSMDKDIRR